MDNIFIWSGCCILGCLIGGSVMHILGVIALRKVKKENELYLKILDNLPGYVFAKDVEDDCRYVFLNRIYRELSGCELEDMQGFNDLEWVRENHKRFRDQDMQMVQSGKDFCEVESQHDSEGNVIQSKLFKKLIHREDGSRLIVGIGVDMTRERELEEQLVQSVKTLDAHIENERSINRCLEVISGDDNIERTIPFFLRELGEKSRADRCGIFIFDEEAGTFDINYEWGSDDLLLRGVRFNNAKFEDFGNFQNYLHDHRFLEIEDCSKPPAGFEAFCRALRGLSLNATLIYGLWDGSRLLGMTAIDYISPHRFNEGDHQRLKNACNFYLMATERASRIKEIENSAILQKQIFDSIDIPLLLFDLDHKIIAANPKACESTEIPEEKMLGFTCFNTLCGGDAPPEWCPMLRTVENGQKAQIDYTGHNGRQYQITTQPIFDNDGRLVYVLEVAMDVGDFKRQEQQLQTMNTLLNNAADLAKITYFTGNGEANVKIIGGNTAIGFFSSDDTFYIKDWMIPEDHAEFESHRMRAIRDNKHTTEMICRSTATGELRSYRLVVRRSAHDDAVYLGILQDITAGVALEEERNELIKSLHNYVENEKIINACLSQVVIEQDFERNSDEILNIIAVQFDCDIACLSEYDEDGGSFHVIHEWDNDGVTGSKDIENSNFHGQFAQWREKFLNDELLIIPDVANSEYAGALADSGCRTLICAPVWVNRKLYGILSTAFVRQCRSISDLDEKILRSTARILALAKEQQIQREELERLDEQNRLIFDVMPTPVCLFDRNRNLLRANPAVAVLHDCTPEQLATRPCYETMCKYPGGIPDCPIRRVVESGERQSLEVMIGERECQVIAIPIFGANGQVSHVVESIVDLTDARKGKRQLEEALKAAEAADRAKSYFLAIMSHELRTPLNAVIGFSELLQNSSLSPEEQTEYLQSIKLAGNSLLYLINDILDLSKLEAEQMVLVPQSTYVCRMMEELQSVFKYKVQEKKLYFNLSCPIDMPTVMVDNLRLRQILLNIIGNAVKFTHKGGIAVTVGFVPADELNGVLTISVADTGIGIRPEEREKIFQPFVQQDAIRDAHLYKGSGLGLAISKRLINYMNGSIRLESEEGKGSNFILELNSVPYAQSMPRNLNEANNGKPALVSQSRVLLVDDIPINLKVLRAMLKKINVESELANSGEEALAILRSDQRFDAILTDIWMPSMSGFELAAAIKANPKTSHLQIIAVTADTEAGDKFKEGDFVGILNKPLTVEKVENIFFKLRDEQPGWNLK